MGAHIAEELLCPVLVMDEVQEIHRFKKKKASTDCSNHQQELHGMGSCNVLHWCIAM